MRRLVLLLVVLGALYWAWRGFATEEEGVSAATADGLAGVAPAAAAERPLQVAAAATPGDSLAESVRRRDPAALAGGYRRLLDLSGAPRAGLADALREAGGTEPVAMLGVLGEGNAFLHSVEGRAAAERVVAAALAGAPEAAVPIFTGLLERAMRGRIELSDIEARAAVDAIWSAYKSPLNRVVFNPEHVAGSRSHEVESGQALEQIARAYRAQGIKLDPWTIALFNRIDDPTKLRARQVLKIPVDPVRTVVEKRSFLMAMYVGDVIFRLYWVGHGKDDLTPETTFTVGSKNAEPTWYVDGRAIPYGHPDNILGKYFVKFEHRSLRGYGAHGTPQPETIGTMASRGCIRMLDADIEEYFRVVPKGSEVEVRSTSNDGSR